MKASKEKLILLVEDDASMRRYLEIILKRDGYCVLTAQDGLEAIQLTLENNFDAIVADVVMPNFTGYDLCRFVKSIPHLKNILFVMLSGMEITKSDSQCEPSIYLLKDSNLKDNLIDTLSARFSSAPLMFGEFSLTADAV